MAKATTTIRQRLTYQAEYAAYFAANQSLFNRVVAFYFEVIAAHEVVLDLPTKEALTALEKLTHATKKNPSPVLPLTEIAEAIPAFFRRAAINAAIGSARSFSFSLKAWRRRKEKHEANIPRAGKMKTGCSDRPPVPPRSSTNTVPLSPPMLIPHKVSS